MLIYVNYQSTLSFGIVSRCATLNLLAQMVTTLWYLPDAKTYTV